MEDLFRLRKSMAPKKDDDKFGFNFAWSTSN